MVQQRIEDVFPKKSKPTDGLVWHYTSPEGLAGIVQNHVLWATSAAFLNDEHEFTTGTRYISGKLKEISGKGRRTAKDIDKHFAKRGIDPAEAFILSASWDGDSLTLWRNYAKHTVGYAIGLRPEVHLTPLEVRPGDTHPSPPEGWEPEAIEYEGGEQVVFNPDHPQIAPIARNSGQWVSVVYKGKARRKIVQQQSWSYNLKQTSDQKSLDIYLPWLSDLLLMKNPGFRDEREVRMGYVQVKPEWKFIAFRGTAWGVTPYVKLTTAPETYDIEDADFASALHATGPSKLPISHIRIGPTPYRKAAKRALRQLLDSSGYSDVTILSSKIPYRQ